jgi:hypothetical protein
MPGEDSDPFEPKASDWRRINGRLVALDYSTRASCETLSVYLSQRADEGVAVLAADFAIHVAVTSVETWFAHALSRRRGPQLGRLSLPPANPQDSLSAGSLNPRRSSGVPLVSARHPPRQKSGHARDQSQSAVSRHRSERAHPRLPWHSQCPLAGIGRGMESGAWLDASRFAAKPQVQGRLASGEEFGPFCKYAPPARAIKPNSFARTMR